MGVEEVVDFLLKGHGFVGKRGEHARPEGGEYGAKGWRRRGGWRKILFKARMDMLMVDHGSDAHGEFSG